LLVGFEMQRSRPHPNGNSEFIPVSFKIVDLAKLECDVKYEFNSDNRRLYAEHAVLAARSLN